VLFYIKEIACILMHILFKNKFISFDFHPAFRYFFFYAISQNLNKSE